jgi:hypothetical protein
MLCRAIVLCKMRAANEYRVSFLKMNVGRHRNAASLTQLEKGEADLHEEMKRLKRRNVQQYLHLSTPNIGHSHLAAA